MSNIVTVSGMFGEDDKVLHTYFADNPVVIHISGLQWPRQTPSPFNVVRIEVIYNNKVVGDFRCDTGGQSEIDYDISSALHAIWSTYDFAGEVARANDTANGTASATSYRPMREYGLRIYTEYLSDDGVFTTTQCVAKMGEVVYTLIPGGRCLIGGRTEWERSLITDTRKRDVSALEHTGVRNGDASTKPTSSPELVGCDSITSWVDVGEDGDDNVKTTYTKTFFYAAPTGVSLPAVTGDADDDAGSPSAGGRWQGHAPLVMRDSRQYVDFLFVNRRGAVETCSGVTLESMGISVTSTQYGRVGTPSFTPSRSLMAVATGGRRSWAMSSGFQTREWVEWWTLEFLMARQWWMRVTIPSTSAAAHIAMPTTPGGPDSTVSRFVPVTVTPAKSPVAIYDSAKQEMSHVDFTVTLALEG